MKKSLSRNTNRSSQSKNIKSTPKSIVESSPVHKSASPARKILTWIGWGVVYVFVFYLGNLSGEYVAAHLPILPSLPRVSIDTNKFKKLVPKITLPKVSVAWKWPVKTNSPQPVASHTTLVIVRGNFINMPTSEATDAEKKVFIDSVNSLAVDATTVTINESCELAPAFIHAKQGAAIVISNTASKSHEVKFEGKSTTIVSNQKATVSLTQGEGAYPISCDGVVAGFYRVN